jgi:hypothetical protein
MYSIAYIKYLNRYKANKDMKMYFFQRLLSKMISLVRKDQKPDLRYAIYDGKCVIFLSQPASLEITRQYLAMVEKK